MDVQPVVCVRVHARCYVLVCVHAAHGLACASLGLETCMFLVCDHSVHVC